MVNFKYAGYVLGDVIACLLFLFAQYDIDMVFEALCLRLEY
jgi:hypothetical protein